MQLQKVIWYEGMNLDPHHFQQSDAYHSEALDARVRAISQDGWGISSATVDRDALANGILRIIDCAGVTKDGFVFNVPDASIPPEERAVAENFNPAAETLTVYYGMALDPGSRYRGETVRGGTPVRFLAQDHAFRDQNTGQDERLLRVGSVDGRILFEGEPLDQFSVVPIAQVIRTPDGRLDLNEDYLPPSLRLGASPSMLNFVRRILERVTSKELSLSEQAAAVFHGATGIVRDELRSAFLTQTLSSYQPVLNHYYTSETAHPLEVYKTLVAFIGALVPVSNAQGFSIRALPPYVHDHLTECFSRLESILHNLIDDVSFESSYEMLPIVALSDSRYSVSMSSDKIKDGALLYVGAKGPYEQVSIRDELPLQLKIAAPGQIETVLNMSIRALPVNHTLQLPAGVPMRSGSQYFELSKSGPYWQKIREAGSMTIFLPETFADLEMEVLAIYQ